jgi:hypothetical protein
MSVPFSLSRRFNFYELWRIIIALYKTKSLIAVCSYVRVFLDPTQRILMRFSLIYRVIQEQGLNVHALFSLETL